MQSTGSESSPRTRPWQAAAIILVSAIGALAYAHAKIQARWDPLFWSGVLLVLASPLPAIFWMFTCLALGHGGLRSAGRGLLMLVATAAVGVSLSCLAEALEWLNRQKPLPVKPPPSQLAPVPAPVPSR